MARSAKYRRGKDVNLKKELVYDLSGRRLTNRRIKQIVKKVRKKSGRIRPALIRTALERQLL